MSDIISVLAGSLIGTALAWAIAYGLYAAMKRRG